MDTRRLILVLIFTFSSFMLWESWQKYNQPKLATEVAAVDPAGNAVPKPSAALQVGSTPAVTPIVAPAGSATTTAEIFTVSTDLVKATISAQGGDLVQLELLKYKEHDDKDRTFILFDAKHQYAEQSGLIGEGLPNHHTIFKRVDGPSTLAEGANELKIRLEAAPVNGVKVAKILTFKRGSYVIDVAWEIANGSDKALVPQAYFHLIRDDVSPAGETKMVSTFTGPAVYTEADKYQKVSFEDIAKEKTKFSKIKANTETEAKKQADARTAKDGWIGLVQHYFVSAWIPSNGVQREFYMEKLDGGNTFRAGLKVPVGEIAPSAKGETSVSLYAGPQEQNVLKELATGLDLVVDYGWLALVAKPIFWALQAIHGVVGNWGWAIVVLTIILKAIFFPLSAASYKSMAKMRLLTPRLAQLKERYGDDKQRLNQEMMKMYQTEKVNPLGGCLPIVVQIPVFIALYWVLLGAVEMRGAPWILWIHDLAAPDPFYILPIIMMVSMFVQTKLNPTPPDPIQAKVMMMMPLIFGFMFFWFPAGLVLYWVVNNVLSIAQQWQITRMIEAGGKAANDAKA